MSKILQIVIYKSINDEEKLAAYAKLYSDQFAADNIRMNNVLPGFIDSLPEKDEFKTRIPMARYGKSEEIAATIAAARRSTFATACGEAST